MTKEEGSVQLADAAWTPRGAFAKSHSINFPHPDGSGRQVNTENPVFQELRYAGLLLNDVITSGLPTNREEPGTRAQIE